MEDEVVGFVNFGALHDEEYKTCGEIFALYIISKYKENDFGRKLVEEAIIQLKKVALIKCLLHV